jgi:sporulation protein YlmC with PRC-barrel domain
MHLLYSTAIGTDVISDAHQVVVGRVTDLLVDPDRGIVEGVYLGPQFLQTIDITSWGHHVHVRGPGLIGPAGEVVRLQPLLEDHRRLIGAPIRTKGGTPLGRCCDFEFNAKTFAIDWILPKKFLFFVGHPIPRGDILEVTKRAIIVKDPARTIQEEAPLKIARVKEKAMA